MHHQSEHIPSARRLFAETAQRRSNTVACYNGQLHLRLDAAEHLHIGRVEDEFIYIFRVRQCEFDRQIAAVRKAEEVRFFHAERVQHGFEILRHHFKRQAVPAAPGGAVPAAVHRNNAVKAGQLGYLGVPVRAVLAVAVQQHKRLSSADIVISNPGIAAHDEFRFITEHIYFKPFLHCSTKSVG